MMFTLIGRRYSTRINHLTPVRARLIIPRTVCRREITTSPLYSKLESEKGFRILALHPAKDLSQDIHCHLLDATTDNVPCPFEALSYVWGDTAKPGRVWLNGSEVRVTANLDIALRHLRLANRARHLWVDALCINQEDVVERSKHVRYVGEVYGCCTKDLLWLGPDETVLSNGIRAMHYFGSLMTMDNEVHEHIFDYEPVSKETSESPRSLLDMITDLYANAVWKRVWVMQELAFAPSVVLIAGKLTLSWEQVENFLDAEAFIEEYGVPDAFHGPFGHELSLRTVDDGALSFPQALLHQRKACRGTVANAENGNGNDYSASSLLDVLERFRFTNATDPRDKIYGLLGLCADTYGIQIDYALSVRDVYVDCMKRLIEQTGNLDLLCQTSWLRYGNPKRRTDLPSWVHDFAEPRTAPILFAERDIYNAGGDELKIPLNVSPTGSIRLEGVSLGSIKWVPNIESDETFTSPDARSGEPYGGVSHATFLWMPNSILEQGIRNGNPWLAKFLKVEPEPVPPGFTTAAVAATPSSQFERFWRTVTMGIYKWPTRRIPDSDLPYLRAQFHEWFSTPPEDRTLEMEWELNRFIPDYGGWEFDILWQFAISDEDEYCMVPLAAQKGDRIAVVKGAKVPLILRPSSKNANAYEFIGTCYVLGFMDGEAFTLADDPDRETIFEIV